MRLGFAFANIIAMVLLLLWMENFIQQADTFNEFYYAQALKAKAEYAGEAAFACYTANQASWIDTYIAMMCNQYDMGVNAENADVIMDSLSAAAYFGVSNYEVLEVGNELYKVGLGSYSVDANAKLTINFYLDGDRVRGIDKINMLTYDSSNIDELVNVMGDSAGVVDVEYYKKYKKVILGRIINEVLMHSYRELNSNLDRVGYIPIYDTENGLNDIAEPTVIFVQKSLGNWEESIISMAGYQKIIREYLVGFEENGILYYCRQEEAPENWANLPGNTLFRTVYDAAEAGYLPATHRLK